MILASTAVIAAYRVGSLPMSPYLVFQSQEPSGRR
jgi:hypothetical protein